MAPASLPPLNLKFAFQPPNQVWITSTEETGTIENSLQLNITKSDHSPRIVFHNPDGLTPSDHLPPIGDSAPTFNTDRLYIYFKWGPNTDDLCTLTQSTSIVVSAADDNKDWYVQPNTVPSIGTYWTLFCKAKELVFTNCSFMLRTIVTTNGPGTPNLAVQEHVEGYKVQTIWPTNTSTARAPVSIRSFTMNPSTPIQLKTEVKLSWDTWADYVKLNDTKLTNRKESGKSETPTLTDFVYKLQAFYDDGQKSEPETRTVLWAPTIATFSASPSAILSGSSSALSWTVGQASTCSIDQGIGSVDNKSGTHAVSPTVTTKYTLTATGNNVPETKSTTVAVCPKWENATKTAPWHAQFFSPTAAWLDNKLWVIDQASQTVWSSTDGATWSQVTTSAPWPTRLGGGMVAFDSKLWLMGGAKLVNSQPTKVLNDVWSSADGATWTQVSTTGTIWSARSGSSVLATDTTIYLLGGNTSYASLQMVNDVWSSTDGATWTQLTSSAEWPARFGGGVAAFNNSLWLMGGATGVSSRPTAASEKLLNDVWYSSDGKTWTSQTAAASWTARSAPSVAVLGDSLFLIGGYEKIEAKHLANIGAKDMWQMDTDSLWYKVPQDVPVTPLAWDISNKCLYLGVAAVSSPKAVWLLGGEESFPPTDMQTVWKMTGASS